MRSVPKFNSISMSNMTTHNSHQDSRYTSPGMKLHEKRSCMYRTVQLIG